MESSKSPAAGGGVEGFTCILQTGSALLPLWLQGVFTLLLCLLQLLSHLLSQLGCPLVAERETFLFVCFSSCLVFLSLERFVLVLPSSCHCCVGGTSWDVHASVRSSTSPPSSASRHTELSSPPHPQVPRRSWTTLRERRRKEGWDVFINTFLGQNRKCSKNDWLTAITAMWFICHWTSLNKVYKMRAYMPLYLLYISEGTAPREKIVSNVWYWLHFRDIC